MSSDLGELGPIEKIWQWIPDSLVARFPVLAEWRRRIAESHAGKALTAYHQKQQEQALAQLLQAKVLETRDPAILTNLGRLYYELGNFEEAMQQFRAVLDVDFNHADALKGLAYCLDLQGKGDEAVYYYLRYLEIRPEDRDVLVNLISALVACGKHEEAVAACVRGRERFPQEAKFPYWLARTSYDTGDFEAANHHLDQALALEPQNAEFNLFAGLLLATGGEPEKALDKYRQVIHRDPRNGTAYLRMAQLLNQANRNPEYLAAAVKAREIFEADHNKAELKFAYWEEGWAYYKLNRLAESIQASTKALEIDGSLAPARFNLALALLCAGDPTRAREEYHKAAALGDLRSLKSDGIGDLSAALRTGAKLPGGEEILRELETEYDRVAPRRSSRGTAKNGSPRA